MTQRLIFEDLLLRKNALESQRSTSGELEKIGRCFMTALSALRCSECKSNNPEKSKKSFF